MAKLTRRQRVEKRIVRRHGKRVDRVKEKEVAEILEMYAQGVDPGDIAKELIRSVRTIESHIEKASRPEVDYRTKSLAIESHIGTMKEQANRLRACITNPQVYLVSGMTSRKPLELNDKDWRLDPVTWVRLCTPDLSDDSMELWDTESRRLLAHIKESPFWKHYRELWRMAWKLDSAYEDAAKKLTEEDDKFRATWNDIRKKKLLADRPCRIPDYPELDWVNWNPPCEGDLCDKILARLERVIQYKSDPHCELENKLQELWDDLLSDNIDGVIIRGRCEKCP